MLNALFDHIVYHIFLPHIASHWCEVACRYMTQGLIEFPMVQLRAEGAIAKDPINHQCGPLARPKWPARWPKIW